MSHGGRQPFGFYKKDGVVYEIPHRIAVARRVIELRDSGMKLDGIRGDSAVRWEDGRKLSIDTIARIVGSRGLYDE